MKPSPTLVIASLCTAAVLALALTEPHRMLSPGPLIARHADLRDACLRCHALGRGVPNARCVTCHPVDKIGLAPEGGTRRSSGTLVGSFHRHLAAQACASCHSDHIGVAGGRAGRRFDHAMLAPAVGRQCAECHAAPTDALHRDAGGACATCHRDRAWTPATFDHAKYFPLEGDHAARCAVCHTGGAFERYTCYGCHEHSPERIRAEHVEEGIRQFGDCMKCHRTGRKEEGEGRGRGGREHGEDGGD